MMRLARRAVSRAARAAIFAVFASMAATGVVAAAWAGIVLAGDRPLPDGHAGTARPAQGARRTRDWTQLASAACVRGRRETTATLDRNSTRSGSLHTRTLRALQADVRIEGRLLARLARLHPGRADRAPYREALRLFRTAHASDRRAVALLRHSGLAVAVQSRRSEAVNGRIRLRFYQVGAFGCATYFDPRSW
jgi:hypothetical protein